MGGVLGFASLQLARDAKASRVEFNEIRLLRPSPSMVPARMARSVSLILIFHMFTCVLSKHRLCGITITV